MNRYQRRMEFGPQPSISSLVSMSTSFRKIYGKKLEELQKESSCDFNPCDEYTNYGFVIDNGSSPLVLDTPCWGECVTCERVGLEDEIRKSADPQLFKVTDVLGRETSQKSTGILFFQYLDGRVERRFVSPD